MLPGRRYLMLARPMSAILFGVTTWDPVSFVGVAGLLLCVATIATLVPAIRAARISPPDALRSD